MLTQKELKCALSYNKSTGIFLWKIKANKNTIIGELAGCVRHDGYIILTVNKERYLAHRLAWLYVYGEIPSFSLDHINNNPSDNRIKNLRAASFSENGCNSKIPCTNTSGIKGVDFYKPGRKWRARIIHRGRTYNLGYHADIEKAAEAVRIGRLKIHGNFARHA